MTIYGADADELERLAAEFSRAADDLDRDGGLMTQLLNNVSWLGDVASRFLGGWTGVQMPRIGLSTRFLREAADQLSDNARQQRAASTASGGSTVSGVARRSPRSGSREYETRIGLDTYRSFGLVLRGGRSDGYEAIFSDEGTRVTYSTRDETTIDFGDVAQILGFVGAIKGKSHDGGVSLGLQLTEFSGNQFIWEQARGSKVDELAGTSSIPTRQTTLANFLGGYSADDVLKDIQSGQLAQPDAFVELTGSRSYASIDIESGASVFGASGSVTAERALEHWADGRTVDVYTMSGTLGASGGAHLDGSALGMSADVKAIANTEVGVSLATEYDASGQATKLVYTVTGHAEAGGELAVSVAGGGATESRTAGVLLERTLTFDLTDPTVRSAVSGASTGDLLAHADWADEEVKVFASSTDTSTGDAIVFDSGSSSSSYELVETRLRAAAHDPVVRLVDGVGGWNSQVVTEQDGRQRSVWTTEY